MPINMCLTNARNLPRVKNFADLGLSLLRDSTRLESTKRFHNLQKYLSYSSSSNMGSCKINYRDFLTPEAERRKPSLIRELTSKMMASKKPIVFMAGGLPNPDLFPFQALTFKLDDGSEVALNKDELKAALQYQPTMGYPPFYEELKKFIVHYFNPPNWDNSEVIVTVGSQNALSGVLEMIVGRGDPVIVPQPVYSSALNIMDPLCPTYLTIPEDPSGMNPTHLRATLLNQKNCKKFPKIMYINPTGANPTGGVMPTERKREIYAIAQEFNILILEDDPYYFLHFEDKDPVSFLSMDVDGRVIRLDSFSKTLSSGLRVGFATGPKELIRTLELSLQASILHSSSMSQVLVYGVMKRWGFAGLDKHMVKVKAFYRRRRDLAVKAAEKHLTGLAEWEVPRGGMFLWIKVLGVKDTFDMLMDHGLEEGIFAMPGREFMPDRNAPCNYLRIAFSVLPETQFEPGFAGLAKLIRDEQGRQPNQTK